jgi:glucose dehydrogenase
VINSAVWLLVVLVLEIDVRLQERHKLEGAVLYLSNASKYILYSALFMAAVYWGVKGDFVDFWDAFLWLVAFVFIELNVVEWRQESAETQDFAVSSTP